MGNYDFELDLDNKNTMSIINLWIAPNSNILEFGSANGRLTKHLAKSKNCNVTIVELDKESGQEAMKFAHTSFVGEEYGNIENYYWEQIDIKYDYIIFADVLEHLSNPKEVLKRCKQKLQDQGRILVSIPNITHNSILINMLNDEFEYDDVGLLDRTHIHFFSLKSFLRMIEECEIGVFDMEPVYSRVGNNEIKNNYLDVPADIERYLRKRTVGSVYQYVFNLGLAEKKDVKVEGLKIEKYRELEMLCYLKGVNDTEYQVSKAISKKYFENNLLEIEIDLSKWNDIEKIRLDPFEFNGIILLNQCKIFAKDFELKVDQTNAYMRSGKLFIFDSEDSWIEFKIIPESYRNEKIFLSFEVLAYREDEAYYNNLNIILSQVYNKSEVITNQLLKEQFDEQKKYVEHLERDIAILKEDIYRLQKESEKWKESYYKTIEGKMSQLKSRSNQ